MAPQTDKIWNIIKSLLTEHDCVIVPGFGGFVCNTEPARIDQVSHLILPPGKRIVFNQNLKSNDGLLAGKIAEKLNLTYSEALKNIEELVNAIGNSLHEKKQLNIEAFGNFRLNADANYVFLPDRHHNYLTSSYGLLPFQAEPVSSRQMKVRRTRLFRDRKPVPGTRNKAGGTIWPKVLVSTLVILLCVNGWIYLRDHQIGDLRLGDTQMNITGWFDSLFHKQDPATAEPVEVTAEVPDTAVTPSFPITEQETAPELVPSSPLESEPVANTPETEVHTAADMRAFGEEMSAARTDWYVPSTTQETAEPVVEETPETPVTEPEIVAENNTGKEMSQFAKALAAARKANWFIPGSLQETEIVADPVVTENTNPEQPDHTTPPAPVSKQNTVDASAYYVIGGVFCKPHNAERYSQLMQGKGYQAELLHTDRTNCTRVSLGKFFTRREAEQFLFTVKANENPEAWLFSKD